MRVSGLPGLTAEYVIKGGELTLVVWLRSAEQSFATQNFHVICGVPLEGRAESIYTAALGCHITKIYGTVQASLSLNNMRLH